MTPAQLRELINQYATACMVVENGENIIQLGQKVDSAIDAVFAERDHARYMCDAIRREFGAGLNDRRPFVLPWEKK